MPSLLHLKPTCNCVRELFFETANVPSALIIYPTKCGLTDRLLPAGLQLRHMNRH